MSKPRKSLLAKSEIVEELKQLLRKYPTIGVADIYKVGASQLHEIRRKFRGTALLRVVKNTLAKIALRELGKDMEALSKYLGGQNILIFAKEDPFKLAKMLDMTKVPSFARPGDAAPEDIVIPEGNTGLPPGPIISELNDVGLPARIVSGSIWISQTTVVAKKGEVISDKLASVLTRLGIKPMKVGLNLKAVYSDGLLFPADLLTFNVEAFRSDLLNAWKEAFNLALTLEYMTVETLPVLLARSHRAALALAVNIGYAAPEVLPILIQRALAEASMISSLVSKIKKRKVEKEEVSKKEEKKEEELGLAALFG